MEINMDIDQDYHSDNNSEQSIIADAENLDHTDKNGLVNHDYKLTDDTEYSNGWSPENEATLKKWLTSITQATYIHQNVLDNKRNIYNRILVVSLIISSIGTIASAVSTTSLALESNKILLLILNSILFGINVLITVLNGTIKLYNFDEDIKIFSMYIEKLDQFYSLIISQILLDTSLRQNAKKFIEINNKTYTTLIQQSPSIKSSVYRKYRSKYDDYRRNQKLDFKSQTLDDINGEFIQFN